MPPSGRMAQALGSAFAIAMERLDVGSGKTRLPEQFPGFCLILTEEIVPSLLHQLPLPKTKVVEPRRLKQFRHAEMAELPDVPQFPLRHPHFDKSAGVVPPPATMTTLDP